MCKSYPVTSPAAARSPSRPEHQRPREHGNRSLERLKETRPGENLSSLVSLTPLWRSKYHSFLFLMCAEPSPWPIPSQVVFALGPLPLTSPAVHYPSMTAASALKGEQRHSDCVGGVIISPASESATPVSRRRHSQPWRRRRPARVGWPSRFALFRWAFLGRKGGRGGARAEGAAVAVARLRQSLCMCRETLASPPIPRASGGSLPP